MKAIYQISSEVTGKVIIRRRKNAKALRQWLRENGIKYEYNYFYKDVH
jgi:phosphoserine phosphatase